MEGGANPSLQLNKVVLLQLPDSQFSEIGEHVVVLCRELARHNIHHTPAVSGVNQVQSRS